MTSSENFRTLEKNRERRRRRRRKENRRKVGSAADKRDISLLERPKTDDPAALEKSEPEYSLKQKETKDKLIVGIVLGIVLSLIIIGIIILLCFLFVSHKTLVEKLDNQQKAIAELKKCSELNIGFTVTFKEDKRRSSINVDSKQRVKFDDVLENAGKGYHTNTGEFTAPYPGLYSFQIHIVAHDYSRACLNLEKGGIPIARAFAENSGWETGSTSAVVEMAEGEVVAAVACLDSKFSTPNSSLAQGRSTVFSGYLIEAADCKNAVQSSRLGGPVENQAVQNSSRLGDPVENQAVQNSSRLREEIACDWGRQLFFNHTSCLEDVCYFLKKEPATWDDAKAKCKEHGKFLAEVKSADQAERMIKYWEIVGDWFWLGGTDSATEGQWVWDESGDIIGNANGFTNWTSNQPDNGNIQNCLAQWQPYGQNGWDNVQCHLEQPYLCQGQCDREQPYLCQGTISLLSTRKSCVGDVCYFFVDKMKTWNESLAECKRCGKFLAEVKTQEEADEMTNIQKTKGNFWLGGIHTDDGTVAGQWVWMESRDNIPLSSVNGFERWTSGQPSKGVRGDGHSQGCIQQWGGARGWDDHWCDTELPFVCQSPKG